MCYIGSMVKQNTHTTKSHARTQSSTGGTLLTMDQPAVLAETHRYILHSAMTLSVLINMTVFISWLVVIL